jgi:hypothetical protein
MALQRSTCLGDFGAPGDRPPVSDLPPQSSANRPRNYSQNLSLTLSNPVFPWCSHPSPGLGSSWSPPPPLAPSSESKDPCINLPAEGSHVVSEAVHGGCGASVRLLRKPARDARPSLPSSLPALRSSSWVPDSKCTCRSYAEVVSPFRVISSAGLAVCRLRRPPQGQVQSSLFGC